MHQIKDNILIIGGESGIGYGLYKRFKEEKFNVYTSIKKKNSSIPLNKSFFLNLSKHKIFAKILKKKLHNTKFDYVLFIAAITTASKQINNIKCRFGNFDYKNFEKLLFVNCFSNLKIFEILKKNNFLKKNSKIVFFSSLAGSIDNRGKLKHNKPFGNVFYRISKAALNCGVKNLSYDFSKENIIASIHPGYVRTKSGGKNADLSIKFATKKLFKIITGLKKNDNGKFLDLNGNQLKW